MSPTVSVLPHEIFVMADMQNQSKSRKVHLPTMLGTVKRMTNVLEAEIQISALSREQTYEEWSACCQYERGMQDLFKRGLYSLQPNDADVCN